jgi:hydroxyacylglutathione hydrolase
MIQHHVFRCLSDNLGLLLHDEASGQTVAVDVPDADAVAAAAREKGWAISAIWITHEHPDHIQGVAALKAATGAQVTGPQEAAGAAPVDLIVGEGDTLMLGQTSFDIWHAPGHAAGHLCFVSVPARIAIVADVLFVMGCGRVFGGAAEMALLDRSVQRLKSLPADTLIFTGHDYTLGNAKFAAHVDGGNPAVQARLKEAELAKSNGQFWAVTTLAEELATNPFLRTDRPELAASVGAAGKPPAEVFAALRLAKNTF